MSISFVCSGEFRGGGRHHPPPPSPIILGKTKKKSPKEEKQEGQAKQNQAPPPLQNPTPLPLAEGNSFLRLKGTKEFIKN